MKDNRIPSPFISLLPVFVLILLLFVTIRIFGSDALSGGSQVCLLTATAVCVLIGMAGYRRAWKDFELAITNNIAGVSTALIILLIIGALSGAWMISGVVPTLIYYGIQVIHPHFFLVSTCVICAIVSVMTGSSWTTIATIGIALMGIGKAQGFSEGWIAGAIISGAYFGDKVSPLSDTTSDLPYFGVFRDGHSAVYTHTLFDDNHHPLIGHHIDYFHCCRTVSRGNGHRSYYRIHAGTRLQIQYFLVADDCSRRDGSFDCPQGSFGHYFVYFHHTGHCLCTYIPAGFVARDSRAGGSRSYCTFQRRHGHALRWHPTGDRQCRDK